MDLQGIKQVADDIKTIKIQWATNIAKAGISILWNEIDKQQFWSWPDFELFLLEAKELLLQARETEPMLFNWLNYVQHAIEDEKSKSDDVARIKKRAFVACQTYIEELEHEEAVRPLIGADIVKRWWNIMTHCHSWSVVKVLITAWNQDKEIHVYNTETRPLYQWRRTSQDLLAAGVPDTMITDDSAPFFVDNLYESHIFIDAVIVGCDSIKISGDVYNKIWSFAIAMAARHAWTPVYIVGSLKKVDHENIIKIERRSGKELRPEAPQWLEIINYAFDMIPAKFITGIITEHGIIKPKDIKKVVKKYCPRMRK